MTVFKKSFLFLLILAVLSFGVVACDEQEAANDGAVTFNSGTYTAVAQGFGGDVEVEVIVSTNVIESIKILNHNETIGVSDTARERLPADITEAQGLKVDLVSGATFTSKAILAAVTDCLQQAGGNIALLENIGLKEVALEDEVIEADVVVVGAGAAGLSAAVAASDAGAKVVLLEKMASVGGATILSGGEVLAAETAMQKEQGINDTVEALKDYWLTKGEGKVNEALVNMIAEKSGQTIEWLQDKGVIFNNVTFSYYYPHQDPHRNHVTGGDEISGGSGAGVILPLYEKAKENGVDIRLETPAVSLINENGVIKGVVAENKGRTVTVNAKSTILATGGYANNEELVKQYSPVFGVYGNQLGKAHNGDGLIMARDAGAEIVAGGGGIVNPMDIGATRYTDAGGIFLNVTPEGKRFSNENEYWFNRSHKLYFREGYNTYYAITDSKIQNPGLEKAVENGTTFKADTIEELAVLMGMKPEVLAATVARYNEMSKNKEDKDFGKPYIGKVGNIAANMIETQLLNPIDQAPYYAITFSTPTIVGTFGGPKTTLDGEVVSTSGSVIPGLYAAGEVANGEFFYQNYPCSGSSIQMSVTMGRLAGTAASK